MLTHLIRPLTGLSAIAFAASLFIFAGNASAALIGADTDGNLYTINTNSGTATLIGNTGLSDLAGLEFGPDNTLYGLTGTFSAGSDLYRINPSNAAATPVGEVTTEPFFEGGLAISSTGEAWGVNIGSGSNAQLISVDLGDASSSNLGTIGTGIHDFNGLVWRNDGQLVGLDRETGSLLAINLSNNLSTAPIAATEDIVGVTGGLTTMDYATGYMILGAFNDQLYSVDLITGAQTLVGSTGVSLSALAAPVPIPPAMWLLGSGLLVMTGVARRKKR